MIQVGNLDWGHLNDILSYLANPIPKSFRLLIAFSWIMLDYPMSFFLLSTWSIFWAGLVKGIILRLSYHHVSPSPKNWVFVFFRLGQHLGSNLGTCLDGGSGFGLGLDKKKITKNEYK